MSRKLTIAFLVAVLALIGGSMWFGRNGDTYERANAVSWLEALKHLPQDENPRDPRDLEVHVVDYSRIRKTPAYRDSIRTGVIDSYQISADGAAADTFDMPHDVDLMMWAGHPFSYRLFAGSFKAGSARHATEALQSSWSSGSYRGFAYYTVFTSRTLSIQQAQISPHLVYRIQPADRDGSLGTLLKDMLDVAKGDKRSFAQDDRFTVLAPAAEALGLLEASIIGESYSLSAFDRVLRSEYGRDAVDAIDRDTLLVDYVSFASGWAVDAKGPFFAVVILNRNDSDAVTNATQLRRRLESGTSFRTKRPWLDTIISSEITTQGSRTIAKFYSGGAQQRWRLIIDDLDNLWMAP